MIGNSSSFERWKSLTLDDLYEELDELDKQRANLMEDIRKVEDTTEEEYLEDYRKEYHKNKEDA